MARNKKVAVDTQQQVRRLVEDLYSFAKEYKPKSAAIEAADYYHRRKPISAVTGGSRYVAPVVKEKIDDLHTQILDVVGKLKDNFSVESANFNQPLPPQMTSQIINLVDATLFSEEDEHVMETVTKEALITGTSFVRWYLDERLEWSTEYFTDLMEVELQFKKTSLAKDQVLEITSKTSTPQGKLVSGQISTPAIKKKVRYTHVPFHSVMVDPQAHAISDANYVSIKTLTTKQTLIDQGYNKSMVLDLVTNRDLEEQAMLNTGNQMLSRYQFASGADTYNDKTLDVLEVEEHFVRTSLVDGKAKLYKVVIVGQSVLDVTEVDLIPISAFRPTPNIDSFWGASVASTLQPQQDVKTAITRGYIDNIHNANHGRVLAVSGAYTKRDLIDNRPNGIIEIQQPGAVTPFPYNQLPAGIDNLMMHIDIDADNTSGVSQEMMGRGESALASGVTASQVAIAHSKSDLTVKKVSKGIMTGVKELCKGIYNEWRKLYPLLPKVSTFRFELNTESGRRSKSIDLITAAQNIELAGLMTPQLKTALTQEYMKSIGLAGMIGQLKTIEMLAQEQKQAQQNPANQLQMMTAQEQIKYLQAQTQALIQRTEIEADQVASELNLKEAEFKFKAELETEEQHLKERAQTLSEFDSGMRSKVAMMELALKAQDLDPAVLEAGSAFEKLNSGDMMGY